MATSNAALYYQMQEWERMAKKKARQDDTLFEIVLTNENVVKKTKEK